MDGGSWHHTGGSDQDHSQEKEMQQGKMVVRGGLTIAMKRREARGKGEKKRYTHLNTGFQRIAKRVKKAFLSGQCKEVEKNSRMGKIRDLFKKVRDAKGIFQVRMGTIKAKNDEDLTEVEKIKEVARIHRTIQENVLISWITMMV